MPSRSDKQAEAAPPLDDPGPIIAPLPPSLLDAPLDFILADHDRQRRVTSALRRFAEQGSASRAQADLIAGYLRDDLGLHHADEDVDLFPAVRRRAVPSDDLEPVLSRLSEDHAQAATAIAVIVGALSRAGDPVVLPRAACDAMRAYARREQRHLAIENGIVMVIARGRLTAHDIRRISHGMKARRGVS